MTAAAQPSKVTYTSTNVDLEAFHRAFDDAVLRVRGMAGKHYPLYVGGRAVPSTAERLTDTSPIDTSLVLGTFDTARAAEVDLAVNAARGAQRAWERVGWQARVSLLRRAAAIIRERKFELAAVMALEVGKSRLESMGDAEESADLIDYYCGLMEEAAGFRREMAKMTPIETNTDVLRAYGVFACIGGARGRQYGGVQAGGGHAVDRAEIVRGVPRRGPSRGRVQSRARARRDHG
jgi:1-pyrroline-5-carboxylate dehydrogenase